MAYTPTAPAVDGTTVYNAARDAKIQTGIADAAATADQALAAANDAIAQAAATSSALASKASTTDVNAGLALKAAATDLTALSAALPVTYATKQRPSTLASSVVLAKTFRTDKSAYNVTPSSMAKIRGGAAAAFAGTARFEICTLGTSITAGTGAATKLGSWPSHMQKMLIAKGYVDGGSGFIAAQSNNSATTDPRVAFTGTWSQFGAVSTPLMRATAAGSTVTFTDTRPSTVVDVWYFDGTAVGFSWTLDGVAQTDIAITTSQTIKKVRVSGLSSTTHTVVLTAKTGASTGTPAFVFGVSFMNDAGVVVHNLGVGGNTTGLLAQQYVGEVPLAAALTPNASVIGIGANDSKPLAATYPTQLQSYYNTLTAAGSSIVIMSEPPTGASTRPTAETIPYLYTLAETNDFPLIDQSDRMVSWASMNTLGLGFTTDGFQVHLTAAGYAEMARTVVEGLGL